MAGDGRLGGIARVKLAEIEGCDPPRPLPKICARIHESRTQPMRERPTMRPRGGLQRSAEQNVARPHMGLTPERQLNLFRASSGDPPCGGPHGGRCLDPARQEQWPFC